MTGGKESRTRKLKNHALYPVLYMFVAMLLFSSILIGIAAETRERVKANERALFENAVLEALGAAPDRTKASVNKIFTEIIKPPDPTSGGAYRLTTNAMTAAYAVPVSGQGFWDKIKGVIGISGDMRTVLGIAFYEQNETPGLGAEIVKPAFRNRFKGLKLGRGEKFIRLLPAGSELGQSDVHAISGATQTCGRLEKLINESLLRWRESILR